ncbi:MAG TPA: MFS transporter [Pseudolysinimonas sp.]|nr:MFS transporter [Pseudolysinimonas sp.]
MTADTQANDSPTAQAGSWSDLFGRGRRAAVTVIAGAVLLYAMNLYFTSALMPSIVEDLGGTQYYAWVTTAFVMSAIIASLFVSRILQARGATGAYLIGFVTFGVGAATVTVAPTMELLVAGRVVQGLGGGLLAGLGYTVLRAVVPERLWSRGVGLVSAMWGIGTLIGPAVGGLFAQFDAWRIAYGAIVALSLLFAAITPIVFRAGRVAGAVTEPLPILSLIPLLLAIVAISLSAVVSGPLTAGMVGIGLALLVVFLLVERRASSKVLPSLTYRAGNSLKWVYLTAAVLCGAVMIETFVPLFSQELGNLTPAVAGLFGAVLSAAWAATQLATVSVDNPTFQRRSTRLGPAVVVVALVTYGVLQVPDAHLPHIVGWVVALTIAGVGVGMSWPLLQVMAIRSSADPAEGGKAAAAITTTQLIAFSITSAYSGMLVALGGDSPAASARYLAFGMAGLITLGIATAIFATRTSRTA